MWTSRTHWEDLGREGTDPESYWVAERLLAGKYPGSLDDMETLAKVRALVNAGVRTFVDLTEENEPLPYAQRPLQAHSTTALLYPASPVARRSR